VNSLTYHEAVTLFEQWGLQVAPGPRAGEVTLMLVAEDAHTYAAHPQYCLPQMAAVIWAARWQNGSIGCGRVAMSGIQCG